MPLAECREPHTDKKTKDKSKKTKVKTKRKTINTKRFETNVNDKKGMKHKNELGKAYQNYFRK